MAPACSREPASASSGSMKWFMPATPASTSVMQAATQEPSTVVNSTPASVT